MDEAEIELREEIIRTGIRMNELGINQGTSGNISVRWQTGILLTPTGIPYEELNPEDICYQNWEGEVEGRLERSSEWRFHLAIQKNRKDVNAVVHTHSNHATALAIQEMEIPAIHYMVAAGGGPNIRCAPYATFGTKELSQHALKALENRKCCLLAHHGVIATGSSISKALWLAGEVETLAKQYLLILSTGKEAKLLSGDEIERVRIKMSDYGLKTRDQKNSG
ncbi:MAG TPA: L-fuculose-phosphate aldolase [SAR324 cluster bacterium]|nr:L-fuculose-phosphate aldolase [SAR324 cluster bacterium]